MNQLHLESLKEEQANNEIKIRQLSIYCNNAIDLLSELKGCFLHNNERYENKVESFINQSPEICLGEHDAQVIEKLIYSCPTNPNLTQDKIKEALQGYADALRK